MRKSVKSRAEEQFAATQKKDKQALKDMEKARQERAEKVERLRALRLAASPCRARRAMTPSPSRGTEVGLWLRPFRSGCVDRSIRAFRSSSFIIWRLVK